MRRQQIPTGLLASSLMLAVYAYASLLFAANPDAYYLSIQEDEYIEWATYLAFLIAAGVFGLLAYRGGSLSHAWFSAGLALFCFVVAMEEISWGQRIFGFRPPDYFLANNYQQELNFHNVIATGLRKNALLTVIFCYGIMLPCAALIPPLSRLLARLNVLLPSLMLMPAFTFAAWLQIDYPMKFTGEWVELMVGFGFLFSALMALDSLSGKADALLRGGLPVLTAWLVVLAMGYALASTVRDIRATDGQVLATARQELKALQNDFRSGKVTTGCGKHKRLYSYVLQYEESFLREGSFAQLTSKGLPEQRAEFFLDPWNTPYWVRDNCPTIEVPHRNTLVYSFGANRRRDSTRWEVKGDDVAIYVRGLPGVSKPPD